MSDRTRIVGFRRERPIAFHASAELLIEGARFNDEYRCSVLLSVTLDTAGR